MRTHPLFVAAALVLSAALVSPVDGAQRQRWPDRDGGGRQQERGDGNGGGRQQDGGGRAAPRAEPRGGDRGERSNGGGQRAGAGGGGRREANGGGRREREAPPVQQTAPAPQPQAEAAAPQERRAIARRDRGDVNQTDANRAGVDRAGRVQRGDVNQRTRGTDGRIVGGSGVERGGTINRVPPRDGNYRVPAGSTRVAVPRRGPPPRNVNDWRGGRNIYVVPYGRTYSYYPRYYYRPYTYGYGPAGRGHFYFDLHYNSYIWHPRYVDRYYDYYPYGGYPYANYGYPTGELRLQVHPRQAQVFVDGYYAGEVDDFDGIFQSLRLEEGEYQIEIVLPGFQPLAFDVRILPGQKVTYRGDLLPERP